MPIFKELPNNKPFFHPKCGHHRIVILPFNNQGDYRIELSTHLLWKGATLNEFPCLTNILSLCPICTAILTMDDFDKKTYKPRRRVIYNVINTYNPVKKVQLWVASHFFTQRNFEKLNIDLSVPTLISFSLIKKGPVIDYLDFKVEKSNIVVPKKLLHQVINPINYLHFPTYEEMEEAFNSIYQAVKPIEDNPTKIEPIIYPHRDYKRIVDLDEK